MTPIEERFWSKVDVGDCWTWLAARAGGYGQFQKRPAHRVAWELLVGPIPHGLQIDHLCRNPLCVNPDHLEPVTMRVNILRSEAPSARFARSALCVHGHNEWVRRCDGSGRRCKACARERGRRVRAAA